MLELAWATGNVGDTEVDVRLNGCTKEDRVMLGNNRATWAMLAVVLPCVWGFVTGCGKQDTVPQQQQIASQQQQIAPQQQEIAPQQQQSTPEPEMVFIKGGTFMMGSPPGETGSLFTERPVHDVTVSDFYMGKYEVTFAEYDAYCDETGTSKPNDWGWGRGIRPVVAVSWNDATAYCKWLSEQTGKSYRLPTEAEWEYACRAGTTTRYSFGDSESDLDDYALYFSTSVITVSRAEPYTGGNTNEVGGKKPNAWGLYDMHGNVWEMCADWYGDYSSSRQTDPKGPSWGSSRVQRGGSWSVKPGGLRSASRSWFSPAYGNHRLGFRVCRSVSAG